jgi:hypothetical protein
MFILTEMALSPVVAAIALLAPVVSHFRLPQGEGNLLVRVPFALHGALHHRSGCPKKSHASRARFQGQDHPSRSRIELLTSE